MFKHIFLILITLCGCTTIPNVFMCVDLGTMGWCTKTISKEEIFVDDARLLNGQNWEQLKAQSLILPADSWAKMKAYLLKNCRSNKDCQKGIGNWEHKAETIDTFMVK